MSLYKRMLLGLDLTDTDMVLLRYVIELLKINPGVEDIYLVHVEKNLEDEGELSRASEPVDEYLLRQMHEEVTRSALEHEKVNLHFEILEGEPLHQILHWANVKKIDLIVAGKKKREDGKGILMEKLAQKSHCSILFIPHHHSLKFEKILLPLDFSATSEHLFERASSIANFLPDTTFLCQNVVEVPSGYSKIGKTYEEFAKIMIGHAKNKWNKFQETHKWGDMHKEPVFTVCEHSHNIAKTIFKYAEEENVDMIIMGSKEQTNAAHFLLGSVAEKVISYDYDIVLLLVKEHVEKEVVDFFKAVKKI